MYSRKKTIRKHALEAYVKGIEIIDVLVRTETPFNIRKVLHSINFERNPGQDFRNTIVKLLDRQQVSSRTFKCKWNVAFKDYEDLAIHVADEIAKKSYEAVTRKKSLKTKTEAVFNPILGIVS